MRRGHERVLGQRCGRRTVIARACSLAWASIRLVAPTRAMPTRSLPSRNLAIVQPWFSSPIRFSAGTRTSSKKTSLTSKPPSISSIGRSVTPGESIGKTSIEMPRCFFSAVGSVRHEAEDPVGVLAERRPGLLAVDHPVVAVADGGGAQRGEVGAGVGLGEALAPPDVEVRRLGQEALLLLLVAEGGDDRADHAGVEGQRLGHVGQLHLLAPDVALQRRPVLAAPLDRPVRHGEPGGVERALASRCTAPWSRAGGPRPCRGSPAAPGW